jgi:hypothetical protein
LVVDEQKDGSAGYKPSRFSFVVLPPVSLGCFFPSHLLFTSSLGLNLLRFGAMIPGCFAFYFTPLLLFSFPFHFVVSVFDSLRSDILDILLHDLAWFGVRCFMPWPGEWLDGLDERFEIWQHIWITYTRLTDNEMSNELEGS